MKLIENVNNSLKVDLKRISKITSSIVSRIIKNYYINLESIRKKV